MSRVRDYTLIGAIALAPTAWFALLVLAYYSVPGAHDPGNVNVLRALHVGAFLLVVVSLVVCVRELALTIGDMHSRTLQRRRFMALTGIAFALLMLLLVIGQAVPLFMLWPGAEP